MVLAVSVADETTGGLTPEEQAVFRRVLVWTVGLEIGIVAVVAWFGGVQAAVILALILMLGVGYTLVSMKKELIKRRGLDN